MLFLNDFNTLTLIIAGNPKTPNKTSNKAEIRNSSIARVRYELKKFCEVRNLFETSMTSFLSWTSIDVVLFPWPGSGSFTSKL